MTKPMPTGSIKKKVPSWQEFNLLLETVDLDDSIGHLFVVDIFFGYKNATQKKKIYNEIYPPIIEKQKILDENEHSAHATLFSKSSAFVLRTSKDINGQSRIEIDKTVCTLYV